jgi:hypothetical protein
MNAPKYSPTVSRVNIVLKMDVSEICFVTGSTWGIPTGGLYIRVYIEGSLNAEKLDKSKQPHPGMVMLKNSRRKLADRG